LNAIILIIPLIIIRYGLPKFINKSANERAGFFPEPEGIERSMLKIYRITTISLLILLLFFSVNLKSPVNYIGLMLYLTGTFFYIKSIIDVSRAPEYIVITTGLYKYSRNPMYVAFFLYFLGINLMINSWLYFILLMIFQFSAHFIILGEERWRSHEYGQDYIDYLKNIRRYI